MRNLVPAYVRVPVLFFIIWVIVELFVGTPHDPAFMNNPMILLFLGFVLLLIIGIEAIIAALENVMFQSLDQAAKARYLSTKTSSPKIVEWVKKTYKKMLGSKPIEKEGEIILDHDYDGIRELDNDLPPWWRYGFYASIVFAAIYLLRYHVFNGPNQYDELESTLEVARTELEDYKKNAKDLIDFESVTLLTDPSDLATGKAVYDAYCVACHMPDGGGGIGPNLTDDYWILGGGIKNTFHTVSEGGRSGKGMVPWKSTLTPIEMAQVSSYILTFQGTTPAKPKEPEGELWVEE